MAGIAVLGQDSAGGTHVTSQQSLFKVGGSIVQTIYGGVASHGRDEHRSAVMAEGTPWFRLQGVAACRAGHQATCGHGSTGRPWFRITG